MPGKTLAQRIREDLCARFKIGCAHPPSPPSPPVSPPPVSPPPVSPPPVSPPVPPPGDPSATGTERSRYLDCLSATKSWEYVLGGNGHGKADCSGWVDYCYEKATGRNIPGGQDSHEQYRLLPAVIHELIVPGDLSFYNTGASERSGNKASHVNTVWTTSPQYREIGMMNPDIDVEIIDPDTGYWSSRFLGYRRPPFQDGAVTSKISASTPFRQTGTITLSRMREVLTGTPLEPEVDGIHAAVRGQSLPVAQSYMESTYGQSEAAQEYHNPLGLLWYEGSPITHYEDYEVSPGIVIKVLVFPTFAAAFREWQRRMDTVDYKNGVYQPADMPLGQFIRIYVAGPGPGYANGETYESVAGYLNKTIARINRYHGIWDPDPSWGPITNPGNAPSGYKAYAMPGWTTPLYLPADIPFATDLTPIGPNRSGKKLVAPYVTVQHSTNNFNAGTGARHHAQWQRNGTQGHPNGKIGVHFYTDDSVVVMAIPPSEQGVHSGDWRNDCGIATERCTNAGINDAKANRIASHLQAGLLYAIDADAEGSMYPHTNGGHCPKLRMDWDEYEAMVDRNLANLEAAL